MTENSSEQREISVTPSLTSLLKPTAKMLGIELRDYLKEKIQSAKKEKQAENVKAHLEAVTKKFTDNKRNDSYGITQLELFSKWVKHSGKVDTQDEELATLWQNLLVDMVNRKPNSATILEKLKQLKPEEACVLNKFGNKSDRYLTEEDRYYLPKLEELGLIETNETNRTVMQVGISVSSIAVLMLTLLSGMGDLFKHLFFSFAKNSLNINPFATFGQAILFWLPAIVYVLILFALIKRYRKNGFIAKFTRRLTWLGRQILTLGQ